MKISQRIWTTNNGWDNTEKSSPADLVLAFGKRELLENENRITELQEMFAPQHLLSCSTSGEIAGDVVYDDSISVVGITFDKTTLTSASVHISDFSDSKQAGMALCQKIPRENLRHVFVLSDGHLVNGTHLVEGMNAVLPKDVAITGGLAGDGSNFAKTVVGLNEAPSEGIIAAIGFYGEYIDIGYGSQGGWDTFGPERLITKSKDNILCELDGKSALDLYKKYLGPQADGLPGSALYFPLSIRQPNGDQPLVRTILSVDEENQSMVFAGNMPEGAYARFMKANFDRIIDGASIAAENSSNNLKDSSPELAILISCVGRKLILGQRIDEEVESVKETLGGSPTITGFYSYGEIAPFLDEVKCELHNQTMTITTFSER